MVGKEGNGLKYKKRGRTERHGRRGWHKVKGKEGVRDRKGEDEEHGRRVWDKIRERKGSKGREGEG